MLPIAVGGLALIALALFAGGNSQAASKLISKFHRGGSGIVDFTEESVPYRAKNKRTGKEKTLTRILIKETPSQLAAEASQKLNRQISVETFVLATLMASEAGDKTGRSHPLAKAAIAHAAITEARRRNRTLLEQLAQGGRLGSQQGGRYASTRQPPTKTDIEIAEAILQGKVGNPAPQANQWDSPRAQDQLAAEGRPGYVDRDGNPITAAVVAQNRIASGQEMVTLPGIDPNYLRLWRPIA